MSTNEDGNDEQTQDSYGKPSACHLYICLSCLSPGINLHSPLLSIQQYDTQNTVITYN